MDGDCLCHIRDLNGDTVAGATIDSVFTLPSGQEYPLRDRHAETNTIESGKAIEPENQAGAKSVSVPVDDLAAVVLDGDLLAALAIDSALADDDDLWNLDVSLDSFPARSAPELALLG